MFRTTFDVGPGDREAFQELVRELADWRLGEYLDRSPAGTDEGIVCKVSHANKRPILFLPDRRTTPGIPTGETSVNAEGTEYAAIFAKIAVNVLRRPGNPRNELATVLRQWFGPDAGLPGTNFHVVFRSTATGWTLEPLHKRQHGGALESWQSYSREQIPELFGLRFSRKWQTGFIWEGNNMFLLVTLEKSGQREEHRYDDQFLSPTEFQWQSQNRTPQAGKVGQALKSHRERRIDVHLFVRKTGKVDGRAAPFTYYGQLAFQSWEGEKPITVIWKLSESIPERLFHQLTD